MIVRTNLLSRRYHVIPEDGMRDASFAEFNLPEEAEREAIKSQRIHGGQPMYVVEIIRKIDRQNA